MKVKVSKKSFWTALLLIITGICVALTSIFGNFIKNPLLENLFLIIGISAGLLTVVAFLITIVPDEAVG